MDGAISEDGEICFPVASVDNVVADNVTHIKLDGEGATEEALRGASQAISTNRPKTAIALYHRATDLRHIPAQIETLADVTPTAFATTHTLSTLYRFPDDFHHGH